MSKGKEICGVLKEIRQQVANENDIAFETSECQFEGECKGTCPKCEAEVRYLENEISKRKQLGKVAAIAGISMGVALTFSSCIQGDVAEEDDYNDYIEDSLRDTYSQQSTLFLGDVENESQQDKQD